MIKHVLNWITPITGVRMIYKIGIRQLTQESLRRYLRSFMSQEATSQVLDETWWEYETLKETVPLEKTFGANLMLRLSALCIAFHGALRKMGLTEESALKRTKEASRVIHHKMDKIPRRLVSLGLGDASTCLKREVGFLRRFPFSGPSYGIESVPVTEKGDIVAFNVLRCPVAEFFKARNLSQVCRETFCHYDFHVANTWNAVLERKGTLAEGADKCDFRWRRHHKHSRA